MASKNKAPNGPKIENPIGEQPQFQVETDPQLMPDEVWAEVEQVSERLGIDKKMAIDLLQLTLQFNESHSLLRVQIKPEELKELVATIVPVVMEQKAKAAQEG